MADDDLEAIRQARMQQLQSQQGGEGGQPADEKQSREAEVRQSILTQILEPDAADRLGRIRLVKASRADDVESRLITLARTGQLRQKVNEEQLKQILEAMSEQQEETKKITVQRRKGGWDDDDLEDLLNDD
ncbi:hypothetical protein AMS68_004351 [Peltaster fructicola]|uniref:DNA-binding TFAR19-related protein n=1 Tax=Peltaster fructicola TaxID=286661 RepID=A0A6H0XVT2_9PEZI|nr:hypothetical protein AMS68_004351 [Peltaster fructicola]